MIKSPDTITTIHTTILTFEPVTMNKSVINVHVKTETCFVGYCNAHTYIIESCSSIGSCFLIPSMNQIGNANTIQYNTTTGTISVMED